MAQPGLALLLAPFERPMVTRFVRLHPCTGTGLAASLGASCRASTNDGEHSEGAIYRGALDWLVPTPTMSRK